jgi:hypothetical protein
VLAAGEMDVTEGIIVAINDHSGSYATSSVMDVDPTFSAAVLDALDRISAPLSRPERTRLERKAGRR